MLFNAYGSLYITEDKKEVLTGNFTFPCNKGIFLDGATIEGNKIHGYRREYKYHADDDDLCSHNIKNYDDWCLEEKDFYDYSASFLWFKTKTTKRLSRGWYLKKKRKEVVVVFDELPTEVYSR